MKVLLAIDDSECSIAAVEAVATQFRSESTEVLVFSAVDWETILPVSFVPAAGSPLGADPVSIQDQAFQLAQSLVEDAAKVLRKFDFQASTCVKKGNARRLILECEESWQPDLIVLGSHGRKGLGRLLLGSVAESVARHAKCSVQIVRENTLGRVRRGGKAADNS